MDYDRIVRAGAGGQDAVSTLLAHTVAIFDESIADALSCANTEEAIGRVESMGLTKTAERLRQARERGQLISMRTRDGLAVARSEGRKGGRKNKLTPEQVTEAHGWIARREKTVVTAARDLGVSRQTLYRALQEPAA